VIFCSGSRCGGVVHTRRFDKCFLRPGSWFPLERCSRFSARWNFRQGQGIRDKKLAPTLAEFGEKRFAPWAKSATCQKTWLDYYRPGLRIISKYKPIASLRLDEITSERVSDFAAWRQSQELQVSSVNSSLQVLRRILHIAAEWGVIEKVPKIKLLPGERHREHVVRPEEEARYLAAASEPLAAIATVLADTGMRPDECYRLGWEAIAWANGRNGTLLVTHGKTAAARRVVPMTPRVRALLEARWESARRPSEGWIWPAPTRCGHVDRSSLKKQHRKALRISGVRQFVLYSLRHTFLTRLGESGCDAWTLARIAGHSSVSISARYVHPSEDAVLSAVEKLAGGHKIGHTLEMTKDPLLRAGERTALISSRRMVGERGFEPPTPWSRTQRSH
jgi:integrase